MLQGAWRMEQQQEQQLVGVGASVPVAAAQPAGLAAGGAESVVASDRLECTVAGCGKTFSERRMWRKHMARHGPRRFECTECAFSFHERSKLVRHQLVHTGERKFACSKCSKRFALKANLLTHMRVHSGTRPYACPHPGCVKMFSQSSGRDSHYKTHLRGQQQQQLLQPEQLLQQQPHGGLTLPPEPVRAAAQRKQSHNFDFLDLATPAAAPMRAAAPVKEEELVYIAPDDAELEIPSPMDRRVSFVSFASSSSSSSESSFASTRTPLERRLSNESLGSLTGTLARFVYGSPSAGEVPLFEGPHAAGYLGMLAPEEDGGSNGRRCSSSSSRHTAQPHEQDENPPSPEALLSGLGSPTAAVAVTALAALFAPSRNLENTFDLVSQRVVPPAPAHVNNIYRAAQTPKHQLLRTLPMDSQAMLLQLLKSRY